jgi:hypothetical protein
MEYFHHAKKIKIFIKKNPSKTNPNPSRYYYDSVANLKLLQHKPKIYHLSKILI